MFKCTPAQIAFGTDFMLCTHFEVYMHAAYVCIYNMSFYGYICTQWLSQVYHFSWLEKSSYSLAILFWFISAAPFFSLCGNWRFAARHRSANIILLWPIHLRSLHSASHLSRLRVKLRTRFCVTNMGNRFSSSKANHLEISPWLVFLGFPHGFHTVTYWGDPSYWNKTPNVVAKETAVQIRPSHTGKHQRTFTAVITSSIPIILDVLYACVHVRIYVSCQKITYFSK